MFHTQERKLNTGMFYLQIRFLFIKILLKVAVLPLNCCLFRWLLPVKRPNPTAVHRMLRTDVGSALCGDESAERRDAVDR